MGNSDRVSSDGNYNEFPRHYRVRTFGKSEIFHACRFSGAGESEKCQNLRFESLRGILSSNDIQNNEDRIDHFLIRDPVTYIINMVPDLTKSAVDMQRWRFGRLLSFQCFKNKFVEKIKERRGGDSNPRGLAPTRCLVDPGSFPVSRRTGLDYLCI